MLGKFGGETLEEIISNFVKVLSHCAKLPFSWRIFEEAQESVLEQVAKTLANIHTGVLSVAAQLHRPVPIPFTWALCLKHSWHSCKQHQLLAFLSASLWEGYAPEVLLKYHSLVNVQAFFPNVDLLASCTKAVHNGKAHVAEIQQSITVAEDSIDMAAGVTETKDGMGWFKACVGTGIHMQVKLRNRCFN